MKVLTFSPEGKQWNSQASLLSSKGGEDAGPFPSPTDQLTVCYRVKIHRYLPDIYWINVFEYFRRADETNNELRSREFPPPPGARKTSC